MKYSLYKDLLVQDNILSHLFLNCVSKENLEKIAEENSKLPKAEIQGREIEIEVKINGISVNPKKFFDLFSDQHTECVKNQAKEMLKEQVGGKFAEICDKLYEFQKITDAWAEDIKWDGENLLLKKSKKKNRKSKKK